MIIRLTSDQLIKLAKQLEALNKLHHEGGDRDIPSNRVLKVDGKPLAYIYWWQDKEEYMAEFLDFKPGHPSQKGNEPLPKDLFGNETNFPFEEQQ